MTEMKQPVSQRRQPWTRTVIYSFMTTTVAVIVAILVLIVLGYSFNQRDGRLEQGGLLQFASTPTGATVTLDELTLSSRTNTKSTVASGSHSVSFDRSGYRTWKKTINIAPGQIGWVNYARLIPTDIKPKSVRTLTAISGSLASPGHKWILLHEAADQPVFELANIEDDSIEHTTVTLPADVYTAPAEGQPQSFAIESWSNNDNAVLIRHTYNGGQNEWILLDRDEPEKSVNINTTYGVSPTKLVFAGGGDRLLFVQTDDIVRRINLDDQTLSRPLVTHVSTFNVYDEKTIVYAAAASDGGERMVGYAAMDIPQPVIIHVYPGDGLPLLVDMATYFNKKYLSVAYGQTLTIESGDLPTAGNKGDLKQYAQLSIPEGVSRLTMSRNGRFVVSEIPGGFATYDLELKKYDKTNWAYPAAAQRTVAWLDDYIIWSDNGGHMRLYDFDGANQQTIMTVVEGNTVTISPNGKYIYGITKSDKGFDLTRAQLQL